MKNTETSYIQVVINTSLLREVHERRLMRAYARFMVEDEDDLIDDLKIRINLEKLLDWDKNGSFGLGIYCGKFESIKDSDWDKLIAFIKSNQKEIKIMASRFLKPRRLKQIKEILDAEKRKWEMAKLRWENQEYGVGVEEWIKKKGRGCIYEGKHYKSRIQCMLDNNLSKAELYRYLAITGQLANDSPLAKKYERHKNRS